MIGIYIWWWGDIKIAKNGEFCKLYTDINKNLSGEDFLETT